jgi:hypothetical protein
MGSKQIIMQKYNNRSYASDYRLQTNYPTNKNLDSINCKNENVVSSWKPEGFTSPGKDVTTHYSDKIRQRLAGLTPRALAAK